MTLRSQPEPEPGVGRSSNYTTWAPRGNLLPLNLGFVLWSQDSQSQAKGTWIQGTWTLCTA